MSFPAVLAFEDGSVFQGIGYGKEKHDVGEIVFNTSMSGYQEIITDPSYTNQIINFTFPHIGNVGANINDNEGRSNVAGVITRQLPSKESNWRSEQNFSGWLKELSIPGIAGIDTRKLTKNGVKSLTFFSIKRKRVR